MCNMCHMMSVILVNIKDIGLNLKSLTIIIRLDVIISRGQQVNNGEKAMMVERGVTENFLVLNPHIKTNLHHFFSLLLK